MRHSYHTIHLHHSVNSTFLSSHLALFCLSLVTLSYKAIAYRNDDCSGEPRRVNLRNNMCRDTNRFATKPFRVRKYGSRHQKAALFTYRIQYCCERNICGVGGWRRWFLPEWRVPGILSWSSFLRLGSVLGSGMRVSCYILRHCPGR